MHYQILTDCLIRVASYKTKLILSSYFASEYFLMHTNDIEYDHDLYYIFEFTFNATTV